jgi:hypothetical protein
MLRSFRFVSSSSDALSTILTDCTYNLCIKCCTDDGCVVHTEQRSKNLFKQRIMDGTTDLQRTAEEKKSRVILKGRFKEPNFRYLGDTCVVWNIHQCFNDRRINREEILRKAQRRNERSAGGKVVLRNSRKRFRKSYEQLYQKSLIAKQER